MRQGMSQEEAAIGGGAGDEDGADSASAGGETLGPMDPEFDFPITTANGRFYERGAEAPEAASAAVSPAAAPQSPLPKRIIVDDDESASFAEGHNGLRLEYFDMCYVFEETHDLDFVAHSYSLQEILDAVLKHEAAMVPVRQKQIAHSNKLFTPDQVQRVLEQICVVQKSTRAARADLGNSAPGTTATSPASTPESGGGCGVPASPVGGGIVGGPPSSSGDSFHRSSGRAQTYSPQAHGHHEGGSDDFRPFPRRRQQPPPAISWDGSRGNRGAVPEAEIGGSGDGDGGDDLLEYIRKTSISRELAGQRRRRRGPRRGRRRLGEGLTGPLPQPLEPGNAGSTSMPIPALPGSPPGAEDVGASPGSPVAPAPSIMSGASSTSSQRHQRAANPRSSFDGGGDGSRGAGIAGSPPFPPGGPPSPLVPGSGGASGGEAARWGSVGGSRTLAPGGASSPGAPIAPGSPRSTAFPGAGIGGPVAAAAAGGGGGGGGAASPSTVVHDATVREQRARESILRAAVSSLAAPITRRQLQALVEYEFVSLLVGLVCPVAASTKANLRFYKTRLSEPVAKNVALRIDYTLQLDQSAVKSAFMRESPLFVAPYFEYDDEAEDARGFEALKWTDRVWTRYDALSRRIDLAEFDKDSPEVSVFRSVDRIRLLSTVLRRHFHVTVLTEKKLMLANYCLHQPITRDALKEQWANLRYATLRSTKQPLEDIRDYFGEDVSFYFAWLGYFTLQLWWPAIIGVVVWAVQLGFDPGGKFVGGPSNVASLVFSLVVTVWAALFLQNWQKFEAFLLVRWGRDRQRLKPKEERGLFKADKYEQDPVDPKRLVKVALWWKQWLRRVLSFCIVVLCLCTVLGTTAGLYSLAYFSRKSPEDFEWSLGQLSWFISISNTVMIMIYDYLWGYISPALSSLENWKTDESYQRACTIKVFLFRTMNNFSSLVYVAFFKDYVDPNLERSDGGSLPQLRLNLATQFFTRMLGNLTEVGWPYFCAWKNRYFLRRDTRAGPDLTAAEAEYLLPTYQTFEGLLGDYMEMALNFAFVTVFSIVLPVIPLLVLVLNAVEMRSDGYKIVKLHRRCFPTNYGAADGIGIWKSLLAGLSLFAIAVNVAMSLFVIGIGFGVELELWQKFLFFVLVEHFIVCIPSILSMGSWDQAANLEALQRLMHNGMKEALWGDRGVESGLTSLKKLPSVHAGGARLPPGMLQMADLLDDTMPRINKRAARRKASQDLGAAAALRPLKYIPRPVQNLGAGVVDAVTPANFSRKKRERRRGEGAGQSKREDFDDV